MCVSCVHGPWCGVVCRFRSLHCLSLSLWGVEELSGVGEERSPTQSVHGNGEWQQPVTEAAPVPWGGAVQGIVWIVYDGTGAGSASITLLQVSVIREGSVFSCTEHLCRQSSPLVCTTFTPSPFMTTGSGWSLGLLKSSTSSLNNAYLPQCCFYNVSLEEVLYGF